MPSNEEKKLELDNLPLYKISLEPITKDDLPSLTLLDLTALNAPLQHAMFGKDCRFDSRMVKYRKWMFEDGFMFVLHYFPFVSESSFLWGLEAGFPYLSGFG